MGFQSQDGWVIARQMQLFKALENQKLAGIVLNPGPSLAYFTGLEFHLSERPVVAIFTSDGQLVFVLPEMEANKIQGLPYQARGFTYLEKPDSWDGAFRAGFIAAGLSSGPVGVEPRRMRFLELGYLNRAAPDIDFLSGEDLIASMRMIKDDQEIVLMRQAAVIAQNAMEYTLSQVKLGMTEKELANELSIQIIRAGSEPELPFQPLVSFGPNSADPHAFATDRTLVPNELILVDWGANLGGYFSDITRVFAVGDPGEKMRKVAQAVAQANTAARDRGAAGVRAGDLDLAAREVLETAGLAEFIRHRTGHGLGRESHEEPYIRKDNDQLLEVGMTFTIEPGLYVLGEGGVRIEDDVVVTSDGIESLTDLPRTIRIID